MSCTPSAPKIVLALLNNASTVHRSSILCYLEPTWEVVAERTVRLVLPEDDAVLRSFLEFEMQRFGEAETLVRWAVNFTASSVHVVVLELRRLKARDVHKVFLDGYAREVWERWGGDEVYVSPDSTASMHQIGLFFPELLQACLGEGEADRMVHVGSSEGGDGFTHDSIGSFESGVTGVTSPKSVVGGGGGGGVFKAREVPTMVKSRPSIEPRLSKAAILRMGIPLPTPPPRNTIPPKPDSTSVGISGVPKRPIPQPNSLKPPSIPPRPNKASLSRQSHPFPTTSSTSKAPVEEEVVRERKPVDFSTTPGHKRLSLTPTHPTSISPPTIVARQNRASITRIHQVNSKEFTPLPTPPREARKQVDFGQTPGHKRTSLSLNIPSLKQPSVQPRQNRASLARVSSPFKTQ